MNILRMHLPTQYGHFLVDTIHEQTQIKKLKVFPISEEGVVGEQIGLDNFDIPSTILLIACVSEALKKITK